MDDKPTMLTVSERRALLFNPEPAVVYDQLIAHAAAADAEIARLHDLAYVCGDGPDLTEREYCAGIIHDFQELSRKSNKTQAALAACETERDEAWATLKVRTDEVARLAKVLQPFSCSHDSPETCPWGSERTRVDGIETGCAECAHGIAKRVLGSLTP